MFGIRWSRIRIRGTRSFHRICTYEFKLLHIKGDSRHNFIVRLYSGSPAKILGFALLRGVRNFKNFFIISHTRNARICVFNIHPVHSVRISFFFFIYLNAFFFNSVFCFVKMVICAVRSNEKFRRSIKVSPYFSVLRSLSTVRSVVNWISIFCYRLKIIYLFGELLMK